MRASARDGTTIVDVIRLSCTGTGRDGEWLRVRRGGYHVADVRTVAELVSLGIDLTDLTGSGLRRPCRAEWYTGHLRSPGTEESSWPK